MIRRSSVIIAASLAVLSTFEPGLCFAAAAPAGAHEEVERPRSLRREIKRFVFSNSTHEVKAAPLSTPLDNIVAELTTPLPAAHIPTTTEPKTTAHHATSSPDNLRVAVPDVQSLAAASRSHAQHEILLAHQPTPSATPATSSHHAPSASAEKAGSQVKAAAPPSDATVVPSKSRGQTSASSPAPLVGNLPVVANLDNIAGGSTPSTSAHHTSAVAGKSPATHTTAGENPTTSNAGFQLLPSKLPSDNLRILQQQTSPSSQSNPSASKVGAGSLASKGGSTTKGTTVSSSAGARQGLLGGVQNAVNSLLPTSSAGVLAPVKSAVDSLIPTSSAGVLGPVKSAVDSLLPTSSAGVLGPVKSAVDSLLPTSSAGVLGPVKSAVNSLLPTSSAGVLGPVKSAVDSLLPTSSAGVLGPVKSAVDSLVSPIVAGQTTTHAQVVGSQSHETTLPATATSQGGGILPVVESLLPTSALGGLANSKPNVVSSVLNGVSSPHFSLQTAAPLADVTSALNGVVNSVKGILPASSLVNAVSVAIPATAITKPNTGAAPVTAGSTPPKSTGQPVLPLSDLLGSSQKNPLNAVVPSQVTDSLFNALTNALNTNAPATTVPSGSGAAGAGLSLGASLGIGGSSIIGASVGVGVSVPNPSATNSPAKLLPSVNLAHDSVLPNASEIVQSVASDVSAVVSSVTGGITPASVTLPNASLVSNPTNVVQSAISGVASAVQSVASEVSAVVSSVASGQTPASVTLPNGSVVSNTAPANIVSSVAAIVSPVTLPSGVSPPSSLSAPTLPTRPAVLVIASTGSSAPITTGLAQGSSVHSQGSQSSQPSIVIPVGESRVAGQTGSESSVSGIFGPGSTSTVVGAGAIQSPASATNGVSGINPSPTSPGPVVSEAGSAVSRTPIPVATVPQVYATTQAGPLTQQPTGYDSMTVLPVPSSIIVEPSTSLPSATSALGPTGLPTDVPLVLYPSSGLASRPENTELIQIGFLYPLNYDFVWQHQKSQQQIFTFLPLGIAYGLNIEVGNITMQTLRAWDTTQDLHYITTLALAWIPADLVETLQLIKSTRSSKFYNHPDPSVRTLINMVNPTIPILADNGADGGSSTAYGATPSDTSTSSVNNGAPIGGGISGSQPVKASSVGIGVGVVCGAAAYGAAMFFVARRYKKRRQSHTRSPSMLNSPVMSHVGPDPAAGAALMSGAMGERAASPYYDNDGRGSRGSGGSGSSARQQISAPVMAENSLGWN